MKKYKNILLGFFLLFTLIIGTLSTWIYSQIESALPMLDGKINLVGLSDTAIVERDAQGIVTLKAKNRLDIAVATGFVHAQERFFQMDLLRRNSAGELSSLFGIMALEYDKSIRRHRFRERARLIVKQLPENQRKILKAYTRGVNQGLSHLEASPFEYLILQHSPVEWQEEDTVLTVLSMYIDLQYSDGKRERTLGIIKSVLGDDVYAFLNPEGSIWDAAIDNTQRKPSPMPNASWPLISSTKNKKITLSSIDKKHPDTEQFPGSNNWAVSGELSKTGSAILANDMHLNIRVPNTWFRASFEYFDHNKKNSQPSAIKVTGLTLPGTPNIIAGSNGNIAWGFTNSYGDWSDIILLETNEDQSEYLTPDGSQPFIYSTQIIAVKGADAVEFKTQETIWGPVIGKNHSGQLMVYRWVAHDKEAVNMTITELELAQTVDYAFEIATRAGMPAQNLMVADKEGNIGWTIMGPIPRKQGNIKQVPTSWANGQNKWHGYLSTDEYPKVKNPVNNRLWTANSRVVGEDLYKNIGNGGYSIGARSQQIKTRLMEKSTFDEKDLLAIALDDEAIFLKRWQIFIDEQILTASAISKHPSWHEVKTILNDNKVLRASTDSVAYRLVRNFRLNLRHDLFADIIEKLESLDDGFNFRSIKHQIETPLWKLITQQPDNFLSVKNADWQDFFERTLIKTISNMTKEQPLQLATWGQQNTAKIKHPLSRAVPFIGKWLDMPQTQLAGDSYMPRVQGRAFGASERMIVSPGHEETGILHMPTSQAGHPWSPYYRIGHSDWEQGIASPFLPGKTKYTLTLSNY